MKINCSKCKQIKTLGKCGCRELEKKDNTKRCSRCKKEIIGRFFTTCNDCLNSLEIEIKARIKAKKIPVDKPLAR